MDTNGIRAALWALIAGQLGYILQGNDTTSGLAKAFSIQPGTIQCLRPLLSDCMRARLRGNVGGGNAQGRQGHLSVVLVCALFSGVFAKGRVEGEFAANTGFLSLYRADDIA